MTKKDYIIIAESLSGSMPTSLLIDDSEQNRARHSQWHIIANSITESLQLENPKFNEVKFFEAVGIYINENK